MKRTAPLILLMLFAFLFWNGCDDNDENTATDKLGGETNIDLTQVGGSYGLSLSGSVSVPEFQTLKDSITVTRNDNGDVTLHAILRFDTAFVGALRQQLGVAELPAATRHDIVDNYVKRFSATLDTSNLQNITVTADVRFRITSEGIQDYITSRGDLTKPFTIVKYSANVGDKYETTNADGVKVTRTVAYKSTVDDYQVGLWMFKVMKVEQTKDDPLIDKITYVTNHKYGLLGVIIRTKAGKEMKIGVFPPTL
jgi:hypothetical protein